MPSQLQWSSLFKSLPKNAGTYTPRSFKADAIDGVFIPPGEVVQVGVKIWFKYFVGFFLDNAALYKVVRITNRKFFIIIFANLIDFGNLILREI